MVPRKYEGIDPETIKFAYIVISQTCYCCHVYDFISILRSQKYSGALSRYRKEKTNNCLPNGYFKTKSNHVFSVAERAKKSLTWNKYCGSFPVQKEEGVAEWVGLPCPRSGASHSWRCYFVVRKGNRSQNKLGEHLLRFELSLIFLEDPHSSTVK